MIKLGIVGYGNLAKGVECGITQNEDMELEAVFTRRAPDSVYIQTPNVPVLAIKELDRFRNKIDVMLICGGSATDLPILTPHIAEWFNVIDSYDNHAHIQEHFAAVNTAAQKGDTLGMIGAGWDPGIFSLNRVLFEAILPKSESYTFWGTGVSQGHSDAIRKIEGVIDARQYTVPIKEAMNRVRTGEQPTLSVREKHRRVCYVVAAKGADEEQIREKIMTMPNYFMDYDTAVYFISQSEMEHFHGEMPHGGNVIRSGFTGANENMRETMELSLKLDSNPQFTANILLCYARALYRMYGRGRRGCVSVLDVAPSDLSARTPDDLRKYML